MQSYFQALHVLNWNLLLNDLEGGLLRSSKLLQFHAACNSFVFPIQAHQLWLKFIVDIFVDEPSQLFPGSGPRIFDVVCDTTQKNDHDSPFQILGGRGEH